MRVYRIESPKGEGVFHSGTCYKARDLVKERRKVEYFDDTGEPDPWRHPAPQEDVDGWSDRPDAREFFCGFRDLNQLTRWFDSEAFRVALNDVGARVAVYEVDPKDVLPGHAQIMFRKAAATKVGRRTYLPTLAGPKPRWPVAA